MRVRGFAWHGRAWLYGAALACLACAESFSDDAGSSGGGAGENGGGVASAGGTSGAAASGGTGGGLIIQPSGGTGDSKSGAVDGCFCPTGGDPYSVLVRGDGDDTILWSNVETPASASLACTDWLTGPLRGTLSSGCGRGALITFAGCVGPDASPPCLLVDGKSVTYVDRDGERWTGITQDLQPSLSPALRDTNRQEGTLSAEVAREGVTRSLSVVYILCGPGRAGSLVPC